MQKILPMPDALPYRFVHNIGDIQFQLSCRVLSIRLRKPLSMGSLLMERILVNPLTEF